MASFRTPKESKKRPKTTKKTVQINDPRPVFVSGSHMDTRRTTSVKKVASSAESSSSGTSLTVQLNSSSVRVIDDIPSSARHSSKTSSSESSDSTTSSIRRKAAVADAGESSSIGESSHEDDADGSPVADEDIPVPVEDDPTKGKRRLDFAQKVSVPEHIVPVKKQLKQADYDMLNVTYLFHAIRDLLPDHITLQQRALIMQAAVRDLNSSDGPIDPILMIVIMQLLSKYVLVPVEHPYQYFRAIDLPAGLKPSDMWAKFRANWWGYVYADYSEGTADNYAENEHGMLLAMMLPNNTAFLFDCHANGPECSAKTNEQLHNMRAQGRQKSSANFVRVGAVINGADDPRAIMRNTIMFLFVLFNGTDCLLTGRLRERFDTAQFRYYFRSLIQVLALADSTDHDCVRRMAELAKVFPPTVATNIPMSFTDRGSYLIPRNRHGEGRWIPWHTGLSSSVYKDMVLMHTSKLQKQETEHDIKYKMKFDKTRFNEPLNATASLKGSEKYFAHNNKKNSTESVSTKDAAVGTKGGKRPRKLSDEADDETAAAEPTSSDAVERVAKRTKKRHRPQAVENAGADDADESESGAEVRKKHSKKKPKNKRIADDDDE